MSVQGPPTESADTGATSPPAASRWTGGRVALLVAASLAALVALCFVVVGAYGLWLDTTQRSDGYVMTSSERRATGSYALATRSLDASSDVPSFLYGRDWLGDVRVRGESATPDRPIFIGIGRKDDVDRYLADVAHAEVTNVDAGAFGTSYQPSYAARPGGRPAVPPERARFWVARVSGTGTQTLTWSVEQGRWAVVVMRPDGSRGVAADLAAGAKLPALLWVSIVLLALGLLGVAGAVALILTLSRAARPAG
jgi:hypothetical protein